MPLTREQAVQELGEIIRRFPRGGGQTPAGEKLLQGIRRNDAEWDQKQTKTQRKKFEFWNRKGAANPFDVADLILGLQLDNKKVTASVFDCAEVVTRARNWRLSTEDDLHLGNYLVSALLKAGYYSTFYNRSENAMYLHIRKRELLEFSESDPYTSAEPFPPWTSYRDEDGRELVKPSKPQLKETVWRPHKDYFFEYTGWYKRDTELYMLSTLLNTWLAGVGWLEQNCYTINQDMLSIVSKLGPPPEKDKAIEKEFEQKEAQRFKTHPKSGIWKDIPLKKHRTIHRLNEIHDGDKETKTALVACDETTVTVKTRDANRFKGYRAKGTIRIDKEWVTYKRKTSREVTEVVKGKNVKMLEITFHDCTRGADNSKKKKHSEGSDVCRTSLTCQQAESRNEYWREWFRIQRVRDSITSKHKEHVRVIKRAKELDYPFYQRAFVDYRGRVYLSRAIVNYTSGDLARGLMQWSEGKRVRKKDLRYLWIHLANTWGGIKGSAKEREKEAIKQRKKWLSYAKNPVGTYNEWKGAGDKWQFIRACIELRNILNNPSFKSCLICEVDQTLSALQHIGLLTRDEKLLDKVMGKEYFDWYSVIANKIPQLNDLKPEEKRKLVKIALVPWVYGGTENTAWKAYNERMEDIPYLKKIKRKGREELAETVIQVTNKEFPQYKKFLTMVSEEIDRQLQQKQKIPHLSWETATHFEVHHYHQITDDHRFKLIGTDHKLVAKMPTEDVDKAKLRSSSPPNLVHSIDASVVHLVLLRAGSLGIPLVTVHDAFGSHLRNVEQVIKDFKRVFWMIYFYKKPLGHLHLAGATPDDEGYISMEDVVASESAYLLAPALEKYIQNCDHLLI